MLNIKTKLATGLATAGLMASSFVPAAFAQDITVQGNGPKSDTTVNVENKNEVRIEQKNETKVNTYVLAVSNTGGNESSWNNGGDNTIRTGRSTNTVTVLVEGGRNVANLPEDCGCPEGDITVKNNGPKSDTTVDVKNKKETKVEQKTETEVETGAALLSNTGKNKTKGNNRGDNTIRTRGSHNDLYVSVMTGDNRVR